MADTGSPENGHEGTGDEAVMPTSRTLVFPVYASRARPMKGISEDVPVLDGDTLRRHGGRILDPDTAAQPVGRRLGADRAPGPREAYRPTAYVADEILLPAREDHLASADVESWAKEVGLHVPPIGERRRAAKSSYLRVPVTAYGSHPPDVWGLVQHLRDRRPDLQHAISLNHLLVGADITGTKTFRKPVSVDNAGSADYSTPGWGGRGPVSLFAAPPPRAADLGRRRPVVAILDTGVADHPWLGADCVKRMAVVDGWVEPAEDEGGKEVHPNLIEPLQGELDPYFGHGTFIAGLIRQHCPDANIVSIKLMGADGVVKEHDLLAALDYLVSRQKLAQAGAPELAVDVLSVSLGYYDEDAGDAATDGPLQERLDRLRSLGVTIVAAAGNDSTTRPFLPAALSSYTAGTLRTPTPSAMVRIPDDFPADQWPPLISVGALNPSMSIALFSNGGDWVACYAPGAVLVSTTPIADSAAQPAVIIEEREDGLRGPAQWRSSLDPDFYTGFGTWSGTSFAAPIVAASLVQHLIGDDTASVTAAAMAERMTGALTALGFTGQR